MHGTGAEDLSVAILHWLQKREKEGQPHSNPKEKQRRKQKAPQNINQNNY